ncbi:ABC transporter permease [Chitinophaga filiformis]|uniref:ABC-type transport system, involved in lipoprotein release, permease component n=1 Tax=Chitinophaga filiformis TaxID=104663 RepID=A0A1G7RM51_CHIFI|nr:ABC transporter permease [Chitinophaga filiformis]SDG11817.1 ABC-type transport system, involved in lipoprotein release, permease component [Chitinophaga filiformis]
MLKNYIKIAWRNLLKDRQFTLLNLVGLSTGLTCAILIYLWINDEVHVDRFHAMDDQLYQVMTNIENSEGVQTMAATPGILARTMKNDMPEVEYAAAVIYPYWAGETTLSVKDDNLNAVGYYAEKDYFNIFSYPLLQGNKDQVLSDKNNIVISKQLALKLFHTTENVVGRTIEWQHEKQYQVSGVFDIPANSSVKHDYILPFDVYLDQYSFLNSWGSIDPSTYLVLKKGTDIDRFNKKITDYTRTKDKNAGYKLFARRYSSGYLYNRFENGVLAGGRIEYVRMFSIIALFILIIASINFMNLSTAKASKRLKEVGIRKVVGADRKLLVFQYLGESVLITFLALLATLVLLPFLLPAFNQITGKQISLQADPVLWTSVLGITLFTGILAGIYPAFYLSGFNPIAILKGKLRASLGEIWVRKGLVMFQFVISAVFIIAVLVVYKQIRYIQTKDPGYNVDNIISFQMGSEVITKTPVFVNAIRNMPGVVAASSIDHASIVADYGSTSDIYWEGKQPNDKTSFANIGVYYGVIETLGMTMKEGRSFNSNVSSDSTEIIFNEAAIKSMGLTNPVGKIVKMWGVKRKIAGVVKDFNFESIHEHVKPFAMRLEPAATYRILVRIKAGKNRETIDMLRRAYEKFDPGFPFVYKFVDGEYQAQYTAENRLGALSAYAAGLAIVISCLGLFGLAAFTAQRRKKEIGIRKVLGASERSVVVMLSADFLKLVLIAVFIAFPLAWWLMDQWLAGFAYRTAIGADVFLVAGVATILITLVIVSYQGIRASLMDPVRSLRTE